MFEAAVASCNPYRTSLASDPRGEALGKASHKRTCTAEVMLTDQFVQACYRRCLTSRQLQGAVSIRAAAPLELEIASSHRLYSTRR